MKAVLWTGYGPPEVLVPGKLDKPVPKENEVLIKIKASTVTAGDCEIRSLNFPLWLRLPVHIYSGFLKPKRIKILGQELAGIIEDVGKDVKSYQQGEEIYATTGFHLGAYAEYVCLPEFSDESVIAAKPVNLSFEEAASVPTGGLEALHFLRKASVFNNNHQVDKIVKILILGAGGSIGTYGVQLAKIAGAEVTAIDSGEKLDMLKSIGADHVIDYREEDFTRSGKSYDVIFDVAGKSSYSRTIKALKKNGYYLMANPRPLKIIRGIWTSKTSSKKVVFEMAKRKKEDLNYLKELIEDGKIKPVIDRTYKIENTADAHRYVESGRKKGNVAITI